MANSDGHTSFGMNAGKSPTKTQRALQSEGDMIKREMPTKKTFKGSKDQPGPGDVTKKQIPNSPRLNDGSKMAKC